MQSTLNPYISFKGQARAAMEFYQSVFGGELDLRTFAQFGMDHPQPEQIMHAALTVDARPFIMGSDALDDEPKGFALALGGSNAEELEGYFAKLSEGVTSVREIRKEVWGDAYGEVTDKFGVRWMFNITGSQNATE